MERVRSQTHFLGRIGLGSAREGSEIGRNRKRRAGIDAGPAVMDVRSSTLLCRGQFVGQFFYFYLLPPDFVANSFDGIGSFLAYDYFLGDMDRLGDDRLFDRLGDFDSLLGPIDIADEVRI